MGEALWFLARRNRGAVVGTIILFGGLAWLVWPVGGPSRWAVVLSGASCLLTLPLHEFGHAYAARWVGARHVRLCSERGRVFVETEKLSRRRTAFVAACGPLASVAGVAAVFAIVAVSGVSELAIVAVPLGIPALSIIPPSRDGMLLFTGSARAINATPSTSEVPRPDV